MMNALYFLTRQHPGFFVFAVYALGIVIGMVWQHDRESRLRGEVLAFQRQTFPTATPDSVAAHLLREVKELSSCPLDMMELADIQMLLWWLEDRARRELGSTTLLTACALKLSINKRRKWGAPDAEGVQEHLR